MEHYPTIKQLARDHGLELLRALERLLSFPENQDTGNLRLGDAVSDAQVLVNSLRRQTRAFANRQAKGRAAIIAAREAATADPGTREV